VSAGRFVVFGSVAAEIHRGECCSGEDEAGEDGEGHAECAGHVPEQAAGCGGGVGEDGGGEGSGEDGDDGGEGLLPPPVQPGPLPEQSAGFEDAVDPDDAEGADESEKVADPGEAEQLGGSDGEDDGGDDDQCDRDQYPVAA